MVRHCTVTGLAVALGVVLLASEGAAFSFGAAVQPSKKAGATAPLLAKAGASFAVPQQKQQTKAGGSVMGPLGKAAVMSMAAMPFQSPMAMQSSFMGPPPPFRGGGGGGGGGGRRGPGHDHDDWRQMGGPQMAGVAVDQGQCNNQWQSALLNEMMNYDNWKCATRTAADGSTQNCVLTGTYPAPATPATPAIVTTGCGWSMPLFCDDSVNDIVNSLVGGTQPAGTLVGLPAGYTLVTGVAYYKVHTEQLTWAAAQSACAAEGAHLAVPSTAADYAAIMGVLNAALPTNNGAYVGITDSASEGVFLSVTGQPMCTLAPIQFTAGEPNGGTAENCLQISVGQVSTLIDIACTTLLPFVCEVTLPARLTPCRV